MFKIDIDDREPEVYKFLLEAEHDVNMKINICKQRMITGDFAIWVNNKLRILIERKTWDDLAASISDNRINEQLTKMKQVKTETNCTIIVIIEGPVPKKPCNRIPIKALFSKIDHIILLDQAHIEYTDSTKCTAERLYKICSHMPKQYLDDISNIPDSDIQQNNPVLQPIERSLYEQTIKVFISIQHISYMSATAIMDYQKWSIFDLYNQSDSAEGLAILAATPYKTQTINNTIGNKRAKKIQRVLGTKKCWIDILSNIQGISRTKAECILTSYPDPLDWTVDSIQSVQYNNKKIGAIIANRILTILNYHLVNN